MRRRAAAVWAAVLLADCGRDDDLIAVADNFDAPAGWVPLEATSIDDAACLRDGCTTVVVA